jgi:hypothetical protein
MCSQSRFGRFPLADAMLSWSNVGNFMIFNRDDVGSRLAHKLGGDVMKKFAKRIRELLQQQQGRSLDQAAMMAANETFPAEFQPTRYAGANHAMEPLLVEIERL